MSYQEFLDSRPEKKSAPSFEAKRDEPNAKTFGISREPRQIGSIIGLPQFVESVKRYRMDRFFRSANAFHTKSGHYFYHPLLWVVIATDYDSNGSLCIPIMIAQPENVVYPNNRSHFRGFLHNPSLRSPPDWAQKLAIKPVSVEMHRAVGRHMPTCQLIANYSSVELIDHSRRDIIVGNVNINEHDFVISTVARLFPPQRLVKIQRLTERSLRVEQILSTSRSMTPSDEAHTTLDHDNDRAADYGSVASQSPRDMKSEPGTTTPSLSFVNELLEATIRASAVENATTIDFNTFWTQFTATTSLVVGIGSLTVGVGSYCYAKQMASQRKPKSKVDDGGDEPPIELGSRQPSNSDPRPGLGPGQSQSDELPTNDSNASGIRSTQANSLPQQSLSIVSPDDISEREQENQSPIRSRLREETNDNRTNHSGSSTPGATDPNPESKSFWEEANAIDERQNRIHCRKDMELQEMVDKMDKMDKMIYDKSFDLDTLQTTLDEQLDENSRIQSYLNSKCRQLEDRQERMAQDMVELQKQLENTKTRLEAANAHREQEQHDHHRDKKEMETKNKETNLELRRTSEVLTEYQESHRQIKHQYEAKTAELKRLHKSSRNDHIIVCNELQITSGALELTREELVIKDQEFHQMQEKMNDKDRDFQQMKAELSSHRVQRLELYDTQQKLEKAMTRIKALEDDIVRQITETPISLGGWEEGDEAMDHDLGGNTDVQSPLTSVQEAPQKYGEDDPDRERDAASNSVSIESFPVEAPMHPEATQLHLVEGSDD